VNLSYKKKIIRKKFLSEKRTLPGTRRRSLHPPCSGPTLCAAGRGTGKNNKHGIEMKKRLKFKIFKKKTF
jgi:hypothetical protein